jgi:preprotein translocase subunit SecE
VAKVTSKIEESFLTRMVEPIARYLRETRAELRKVSWPSREEAWNLTLIVLAATTSMALILGAGDFIFADIVRGVVTSNWLWIGIGVLVVVAGVAAVYFIERE